MLASHCVSWVLPPPGRTLPPWHRTYALGQLYRMGLLAVQLGQLYRMGLLAVQQPSQVVPWGGSLLRKGS